MSEAAESNTLAVANPHNALKNQQQQKPEDKKHPLQGLTIETVRDSQSEGGSYEPDSESGSLSQGDEFEHYNIDVAIHAWDQIGELTHEITSSLMAKQASMLCERFRQEDPEQQAPPTAPPAKKRRVEKISARQDVDESSKDGGVSQSKVAPVVSSDEETSNAAASTKKIQRPDLMSGDMYSQVDRIGRMSKLVMEIEYCQSELRKEMLAMSDQLY